jgi:hypothetical protein
MPRDPSNDAYLTGLQRRLCRRQTLAEFTEIVESAASVIGDDLVTNVKAKAWREAFVARYVAEQIQATHAACVNADPPDVRLYTKSGTYSLEVTEILSPNRKRHKEYKEIGAGVRSYDDPLTCASTPEQINQTPNSVLEKIASISSKKVAKLAGKDCSIVLYLNNYLSTFPRMIDFIALTTASSELAKVCVDVWLLISGKLYLLWCNGLRVEVTFELEDRFVDPTPLSEIFEGQ